LLICLIFLPVMAFSQTFNASKQIVSVIDFGACIKFIHVDSSVTVLPKTSVGFTLCGQTGGKAVNVTTKSGGSNNYTYGFQSNGVVPSLGTNFQALDTLKSWIGTYIAQ